jgi:ADP-ribose pyrophosphatase YjhB (NUDIX family)
MCIIKLEVVMARYAMSAKEFRSVYSVVARSTVELIVRTPTGIVLSYRTLESWKNRWHIPGGHVFYGKDLRTNMAEVAQEELGISVRFVGFLGPIEYTSEQKERGYGWAIGNAIICEAESLNFRPNEDAGEIRVFSSIPENIIEEQGKFLHDNWGKIKNW